MIFISVILSMVAELWFSHVQRFKYMSWIPAYRDKVLGVFGKSPLKDGPVGLIVVMLFPLLLFYLVQISWVYNTMWLGIPGIAFNILVLMYCLRFYNLDNAIDTLCSDDIAHPDNRLKEDNALKEVVNDRLAAMNPNPVDRNHYLTQQIFIQANERLFAVLFWFIVFGPLGAIMYRITWQLVQKRKDEEADLSNNDSFDGAAYRLYGILVWVPARITAIGYALAGGFEDAIHNWKEVKHTDDIVQRSHSVMAEAGSGAIRVDQFESEAEIEGRLVEVTTSDAMHAARGLIIRTLLVWLTLIGIITLTGLVALK